VTCGASENRAARVAIFNTDADSFHGLPDPIRCPEGTTRKSLALYYFTGEPAVHGALHRVPRAASDGAKGIAIWADKGCGCDKIKRRFGLSESSPRVLGMFSRKK
jgi:hypothetical protein